MTARDHQRKHVHVAICGVTKLGARFGIVRGTRQLDYAALAAELPIALWPLPGCDSYGVRANADAAVQALNLRQARAEVTA